MGGRCSLMVSTAAATTKGRNAASPKRLLAIVMVSALSTRPTTRAKANMISRTHRLYQPDTWSIASSNHYSLFCRPFLRSPTTSSFTTRSVLFISSPRRLTFATTSRTSSKLLGLASGSAAATMSNKARAKVQEGFARSGSFLRML